MVNADEQALLAEIDPLADRLTAWLTDIVRIPTVNPYCGDDSAGSEALGQDWMAARFGELDGAVSRIPIPSDVYARAGLSGDPNRRWEGRENVTASWSFAPGGPTVILNTHMDTVGASGMEIDPFGAVVKDGKLFGRGSGDSKGNLVMGLTAMRALLAHARGLRGRIIFESVVDEECGGAGAGTLACCLSGLGGDYAIVLDGARGNLAVGCNGVLAARLFVKGRAGHSALGSSVSAIDKGFAVKQWIDEFFRAYTLQHPTCQGGIRVFRAGTRPSVVPGLAEMWVYASYDTAEARRGEAYGGRWGGDALRRDIENGLRSLPDRDPWFREMPVRIEWMYELLPFETDPDGPLPLAAMAAARDAGSFPVERKPMTAWFDASHFARVLRVPVVGLGHGTPGMAHSANESVCLADLLQGAKTLALLLFRLLR